jgi:glycosyltransferase involved in cell wall biosynthesis
VKGSETMGTGIRLLKFLTNFKIGGTERQVLNLARSLDPAAFELHVGCLGRSGDFLAQAGEFCSRLSEYKIRRLYGPAAHAAQFRFARRLRRDRIQIVHSYGFYSNVFALPAARLAGVPVVLASIRDIGDPLSARQRLVQRFVCHAAHCIIANAEAVRSRLVEQGYRAEKIAVIRNGVVLPPKPAPDGRVRRELQVPAGAPLVGVISRLNPLKGIEYFLDAAARLSTRFGDARFVIVGDGIDPPYRESLERRARTLGLARRVIFTGFRLDMESLLAELDVSVLPSLSEGLSNVLLESMAAGIPVVATRVGGNPEVVADGVTGFLVPTRDSGALVDAVARLLENRALAAAFGEAGRKRAEREFSVSRLVAETENLYRRLLAGAGAVPSRSPEVALT